MTPWYSEKLFELYITVPKTNTGSLAEQAKTTN